MYGIIVKKENEEKKEQDVTGTFFSSYRSVLSYIHIHTSFSPCFKQLRMKAKEI
jgi:hypothetical protein